MNRAFRLTRRAEESLVDIALWTIEAFGPRQADLYEAELIERCEAIARGEVLSRSCAILIGDITDLRYARAGEHFVVYLERPDDVVIVDFLHGRSDLPRHVAALTALTEDRPDES